MPLSAQQRAARCLRCVVVLLAVLHVALLLGRHKTYCCNHSSITGAAEGRLQKQPAARGGGGGGAEGGAAGGAKASSSSSSSGLYTYNPHLTRYNNYWSKWGKCVPGSYTNPCPVVFAPQPYCFCAGAPSWINCNIDASTGNVVGLQWGGTAADGGAWMENSWDELHRNTQYYAPPASGSELEPGTNYLCNQQNVTQEPIIFPRAWPEPNTTVAANRIIGLFAQVDAATGDVASLTFLFNWPNFTPGAAQPYYSASCGLGQTYTETRAYWPPSRTSLTPGISLPTVADFDVHENVFCGLRAQCRFKIKVGKHGYRFWQDPPNFNRNTSDMIMPLLPCWGEVIKDNSTNLEETEPVGRKRGGGGGLVRVVAGDEGSSVAGVSAPWAPLAGGSSSGGSSSGGSSGVAPASSSPSSSSPSSPSSPSSSSSPSSPSSNSSPSPTSSPSGGGPSSSATARPPRASPWGSRTKQAPTAAASTSPGTENSARKQAAVALPGPAEAVLCDSPGAISSPPTAYFTATSEPLPAA